VLAQALHHQPDHQRADQIGQQRSRCARGRNNVTRIKKQPGANHAAEGEHDQVAGLHGAL